TPRLVVNDYPENLDAIAALLGNLDTPPSQVLVEATVLQTAVDESDAWGVDFTLLGDIDFIDFHTPLGAVNNLLDGDDPRTGVQPADNRAHVGTTSVGNTGGAGGLKIGVISNDIAVFLRVLDEVVDSQVLARPKIMALNRQRAEVLVGARIGYLSTTSTETTTTQSVQFLDTGIQLVFRPFISKDGMIRMELKPSVSEASLRSVTDATGSVVTIPDELTNQVTTNVRIQDGQTLVLGGLFKDQTSTTRRNIPILGDLPLIGPVFSGQDDRIERSEVIFLITPSIVHDEKLWAAGEEHLATVDSLRVGARAGLLPWSKDKVTSSYNQKAVDAYNAGQNDEALHHINKSLNVSPNQPEMIRLRETITGEKISFHERSLMQRAFRKQIGSAAMGDVPSWTPTFENFESNSGSGQGSFGNFNNSSRNATSDASNAGSMEWPSEPAANEEPAAPESFDFENWESDSEPQSNANQVLNDLYTALGLPSHAGASGARTQIAAIVK
ncbi:MAG: type II and III secretion system protein, partial [Phycisphaerales bacterium]|nr:type II and III secretion system protein [Phycisphaerales bacterium]